MTLPALAVQRPVATFMLLLSLLVLGVVAFPRLSIEFFPLVEPPVISVVVPFPGSHPLEGLRQVVLPLEGELAAISGVTRLSGSASTGQARLTVRFNWSQDMALKKMEVRDAVDRIHPDLPEGIGRILIQTFRDGPSDVMLRGRIAAERDLSRSYSLLEQHIVRPLERIKGVASVRLDGVYAQQVRIQIEPQALLALLQDSNLDMDPGSLHDDLLEIDVRLAGQFQNLEQIRTLRIGRGDLLLRDVASVNRLDPPVEYGRHLDGEFALGIDVYKEPSANTVAAVDRLMDKIKAIRSDPELRGIHLLIWNDQGREIRQSLVGLRNAGLFGGLLAVVVLFLFLRRLSTTLIVAVAIPFSLLVTCGIMYLLGAELDVLAMLGLMVGVGMLVDNAVVVIENIHRLEGQGMPASKAATLGARQVSLAVIAATATTVIVWSWLFTLERSPMVIYLGAVALPLCLAVLSSLLISLTFIPMAAARFVPRQAVRPGFLLRRLVPVYRAVLGWTLRHRVLALAGLIILAGSAYIPYSLIEKTGDVSEQGRDVSIVFRVHDPSDLNTMEVHVNRVEAWLKNKKAKLGYESVYSFYNQHGYAVTRIFLPWERATEAFLRQTRERLQADLPIIPGVTLQVGDQDRFARRGDRRLVTVALRGEDAEYLRKVATGVEDLLHGVEGVKEIFGPTLQGEMEAHILVDSERARTLGLSPQQIADAVTFTFRGRRLRGTQNGM
ncbi:MAG: efflux RND transporter permease subunit [Acidobacteriota bacterium]